MVRTWIVAFGVVALGCGGAIGTEPLPITPCTDEDILTRDDVSTFEIDGSSVVWGTETGDVAVRDSRGARVLGSAGNARVVSIAVEATRVFAVSDRGIFAFDRAQGTRTVVLESVDHPVAIANSALGLFYLERGSGFSGARLVRIAGTEVTVVADKLTGASALAVDATGAYFMTARVRPCELVRVPLVGGDASVVWTEGCSGQRIVLDATKAYVAGDVYTSGTVPTVSVHAGSKAGTSEAIELGWDVGTLAGFAVDDANAYVALSGPGTVHSTLIRRPLSGGPTETLATATSDDFGELRVSPTALYRARVRGTQPRIEKRCKPIQ